MNTTNDDFNLQDLWQRTPPVDVDKLIDSVKKADSSMRKLFYFELGSSLVMLGLVVWAALAGLFDGQLWLPIVAVVGGAAFQVWSWTWRSELWNAIAESPRQLLQVRRKHLLLDIKIAESCYWSLGLGAIAGSIAAAFDKSESVLDLTDLQRGSILTALAVFAIVFLIWSVRKKILAVKKLKILDKKIKEFESEESL